MGDVKAGALMAHLDVCEACRAALEQARAENGDASRIRGLFAAAQLTDVFETAGDAEVDRAMNAEQRPTKSAAGSWSIPDYERVVLCGEGAYGSVWVVRDRVGVYRALKTIHVAKLRWSGAVCREKAALEAYCRKVSGHRNLIAIHHVGMDDELLYYTMELADDALRRMPVRFDFTQPYQPLTLETIINGGTLDPDVAMEVARRLLRGLARLHEEELVHRDIKPSNIVFVDRRPKLADIGMVAHDTDVALEVGTPEYMPPDRVMNKTADVYAFGKILHEMIAGRAAESFPALPRRPAWSSTRWNPDRIAGVIACACAAQAADRYQSAEAMLDDVEACAELSFGALLDSSPIEAMGDRSTTYHEAIQLGYAFLRTIPWIFGIILVLVVASYLR